MSEELYQFMVSEAPAAVLLETLEVSHSSWSASYYLVRNDVKGRTLVTESGSRNFIFVPFSVTQSGDEGDLQKTLTVDIGDLGEIIPEELVRMETDDSLAISPSLIYRGFSSLTGEQVYGPLKLEVTGAVFIKTGVRFRAEAKSANSSRTGEPFTVERHPTIRSFL